MSNIHQWDLIETNKTTGSSKVKCPVCTPTRKNKSDRSLMVWFNDGIAKCYNSGCDALFFKDNVEKTTIKENYKIPLQTWRNYTSISDSFIKALEGRKISQSTLIELGITQEKFYQPSLQREVDNLVFNFFEGETIVNKKYRGAKKSFTQSAGTKSIFYNINSIIGENEAYIVEGEFDVCAIHQIGIKNVISLPNGANDNDNFWINSEKYLKDIKKFYIGTDNDTKGDEVAEKIAQRLGRFRCERIVFEGKDANEDLISGVLDKTIYKTIKYPVSGTFKVSDCYDDIISLYDNGLPETISPKHKSFGDLKKVFSVMRGHLITGTGIPSHGKSNFTEWYVLNLVNDYKMKASFFSPEHHPFSLHHTTFIEKATGRNFWKDNNDCKRVNKYEIAKYQEWAEEKIYLTGTEDGEFPTWDWLFDKFKEQLFSYGIDIFVIDAFNKLGFVGNGNRLQQINDVLTKLTMFAQMNNVIIFLVAHPTKMQKGDNGLYNSPSLYDVSGSADFRNQTHDGFSVYRFFGDTEDEENQPKTVFENLKTKMKFQGEIGAQVEYDYHVPSGRYYAKGEDVPTFTIWEEQTPKKEFKYDEPDEVKLKPKTLVDAFGEDYDDDTDVPF